MSEDFATATAIERLGPGRFGARIPDGWQQGRGAFGGLVLGTLARAIIADEPPERALRTLAGDLCGPVLPGEAEIVTRVLRRGNNQSNVSAELRQGGQVLALASAVLSTPRTAPSSAQALADAPPAPADWRALSTVPMAPPHGPNFAAHYEYRSLGPPFGPTAEPRVAGFVRERAPLARLDAPALIARLDAWWPALFLVEGRPRPMATASFVAELLEDPASLAPTEPLRYRARQAGAHEGFCVELRELWHGDRVVALNQQTFAIIK
jgi:hypothetical protein